MGICKFGIFLKSTDSELNQILEFAKKNNWYRVVIFKSNNLLRDEKRLLKIFKMNSLLNVRHANIFYSSNFFNSNGHIRILKIGEILKGEARYSSEATFKMVPLELD